MSKIKLFLGLFLMSIFLLSCSEPTLEDDARTAAFLTKQSMEYSLTNDLKNSESNYMEVQKIMDKYRYSDDFGKFYEMYNFYLQEYAGTSGN